MAIVEADDLFKFYHPGDAEVRALRGASLTVERGETVALVGPSGSGKSTLLACLAGVDEPDGGHVMIDGCRMTRRPEAERATLRGRSIGFLAQMGNLFDHLTVAENVRFQLSLGGKRDHARVGDLLRLVGLIDRATARPGTLSGGEFARAGLAVALATDPPVLLADEPTAEVDGETEARILELLEARRRRGGAALIATHSSALSAAASRVLKIADGIVTTVDAPQSTGPAAPRPEAAASPIRVRSSPVAIGAPLMVARGLARTFGTGSRKIDAVSNASCRIFAADRIAIMGPSGSGKSTLLHLLAGLQQPTAGEISWPGLRQGEPLLPLQIGFVFQAPSLLPALTTIENVQLPIDIAGIDPAHAMRPMQALELLSLSELADKLPDQLSGGQMQMVALARALVTRPRVLFADEPTGQLDRETGQQLLDATLAAVGETGTALVVATHDPLIAQRLQQCWRMDAGRLISDDAQGQAA
jgi:ABC-type lipoprotein export system ATPase subunit